MKKLVSFIVSVISVGVLAGEGSLLINVELFPVGSFDIKSTTFKGGKLKKKGNKFMVKNIYVPVPSMETGIKLRDEHMRKRLGGKKVLVKKAVGKDGNGKGIIVVNEIEKPFEFTYEDLGGKVKAKFVLSVEDFSIEGTEYMGVGVEDELNLTVVLPY